MALLRCLTIVFPLTALATVLGTTNQDPGRAGTSPASLSKNAPAADKVEKTGHVGAWYVFADGTVALRLVGQDKGESFATWFITPADKTETTRFEHLMLGTALTMSASREQLTIAYEQNNEKLGKTLKDAVPIHAVMWGTTFHDAGGVSIPKK